jgi:general secretion pathway protein D
MNNAFSSCAVLMLAATLAACNTQSIKHDSAVGQDDQPSVQRAQSITTKATRISNSDELEAKPDAAPELYFGNGNRLGSSLPRNTGHTPDKGYTLNFKDTDVSEVVKYVLGDILALNYTMDANLKGKVNLALAQPVPKSGLIPALESILAMHGAVLLDDGTMYRVQKGGTAKKTATVSSRLDTSKGFQSLVRPLKYIAASDMQSILGSMASGNASVQVDKSRNAVMLTGTQAEIRNLLATIDVFDVNQMAGMSVGIFRLDYVKASTLAKELEAILAGPAGSGVDKLVRFVDVKRMNALLAITPQRAYLETIRDWVKRLDQAELASGRGLYVYFVQNGDAQHLASLLQELYGGVSASAQTKVSGASPDLPLLEARTGSVPRMRGQSNGNETSSVTILADEQHNALLIQATPNEYAQIEKMLQKLDILPSQVLVEATIVEVTLSDEFSMGLEWFFKSGAVADGKNGLGRLDLGSAGLASLSPGFSYSLSDGGGNVRAVLNALASDSRLRVISSPSLMVLDNTSATIDVGDQVPIRTSESSSIASAGSDSIITSTIQYRDTGVKLQVTPRVNNSKTIIMEIAQNVSTVDQTKTSGIDSPTINQRNIQTTVAVKSGETIVLGGLIREDQQDSASGLPFLRKLPVLGKAFSAESQRTDRTELLVLITPVAISDEQEAREATAELRAKLKGISF